jgi:two-component system chemotaxis response regulator CheB
MWEIDEESGFHYRCLVGHAYSAEAMNLGVDDNLRRALGSALRALEERVALTEKLRKQASHWGHNRISDLWARKQATRSRGDPQSY